MSARAEREIVLLITTFRVLKAASFVFLSEKGCKSEEKVGDSLKYKDNLAKQPYCREENQFGKMSIDFNSKTISSFSLKHPRMLSFTVAP